MPFEIFIHMAGAGASNPETLEGIPFSPYRTSGEQSTCTDLVILSSDLCRFVREKPVPELTGDQKMMLVSLAVRTALEIQESLGGKLRGIKTHVETKLERVRDEGSDVQITEPQFKLALRQVLELDPEKDKDKINKLKSWFNQYSKRVPKKPV